MLFTGVYILWENPLIVSCQGAAELLSVLRLRQPATILYSPTWLWTMKSLPQLLWFRWYARQYGKALHFMCNAPQSNRLLRRLRFPGALVSINCYINEHVFRITAEPKIYKAVYAARMVPYKRLHLAAQVSPLFVQTYGECRTPDGAYDLHRYEPALRHAEYNRHWVSVEEIVAIYNQATVGLALSACEGAMLASVEYMLCGLPQVSTPCRGGRELFFDAPYVAVVEATPEAVAVGVNEIIARKIDPQFVREMTLHKIYAHRTKLCNYVRNIIRQARGNVPSPEQLYAHLFDDAQGVTRRFVHFRNYAACGLV